MTPHNETILTGKKVILFPLSEIDLDHFVRLHRADKNGYMQRYCLKEMTEDEAKKYAAHLIATNQIFVFTVLTKEGKASRRAGYVYITDLSNYACEISGIMDIEFARGLGRMLRKDKYTYSQDAVHTLLEFLFNKLNLERVQISLLEKNVIAIALAKKEGFEHEGTLRKYLRIGDTSENVAIMSIIRETPVKAEDKIQEVTDGKVKTTAS
jgi:RimJ/RimL family protein N-acetyltransferase